MLALFLLAVVSLLSFVSAQVPTFPSNIVVFPERDYVTVEGFNGLDGKASYAGQQLTLQVLRTINGVLTPIGEVAGTVSGSDIAFEVNHVGFYCWGDGSALKVTPDIQRGKLVNGVATPGDTLRLLSGTTLVAQTVVQNGVILSRELSGNTISVSGEVFALADPNAIELRIVQPPLADSIIGRRDVRAIPGPAVTQAGYSSQMVVTGSQWTATLTFVDANGSPDPVTAATAYGGAFSVSTWQITDAAGNAQGLTISEFGEVGGPMSAACPPYAGSLSPVLPEGVAVTGNKVYWNAAQDQPGTLYPFNFYNVEVLRASGANSLILGAARVPKGVHSFTLPASLVLATNDVIEVRALQRYDGVDQLTASRRKSVVTQAAITAANVPTFSAGNNAAARTLRISSAQGLQIAYTITAGTAATPVVLGDAKTIIYTAGTDIAITGTQTLQAIAFTTEGVLSAAATVTVTNAFPGSVSGVTATLVNNAGNNVARIAWNAVAGVTGGFKVYGTASGVKTLVATVTNPAAVSADIGAPPLLNNAAYTFTVAAFNTVNNVQYDGPESTPSNAVSFVTTDTLTVTSSRYRAGNELRVSGTGSVNGAVVTFRSGTATGVVLGSATVNAGVFDFRLRPVATGITTVFLVSSFGFVTSIRV